MVIALAGRRDDAPEAKIPRFPTANAAIVKTRIAKCFRDKSARVLVCSAASGADLLALEVAGEIGIERYVVLPYSREKFRETSVVDAADIWGELFDSVIDKVQAQKHLLVLPLEKGDTNAYAAVNRKILDQAIVIATHFHLPIEAVVVWEGRAKENSSDMTAQFLQEAITRQLPFDEVATTA